MSKLHIRKDDKVQIISGDCAGNTGKVIQVSPKEGKVIIEKQNMVIKHVKPKKSGDPEGLVKAESAIYACKVQVVCPHCNKATRVGHKIENGSKNRVCKKCGKTF